LKHVLDVSERVLGAEYPQTLGSVNNLAALYRAQGRYGKEHPDTLLNVNNLAFLYQSLGRYSEAEPLYKDALEVSERVLGRKHPHTPTSLGNDAGLLTGAAYRSPSHLEPITARRWLVVDKPGDAAYSLAKSRKPAWIQA